VAAKIQRFWKAWWVVFVGPASYVAVGAVASIFDINEWLAAVIVGIVVGTVLRTLRPPASREVPEVPGRSQ